MAIRTVVGLIGEYYFLINPLCTKCWLHRSKIMYIWLYFTLNWINRCVYGFFRIMYIAWSNRYRCVYVFRITFIVTFSDAGCHFEILLHAWCSFVCSYVHYILRVFFSACDDFNFFASPLNRKCHLFWPVYFSSVNSISPFYTQFYFFYSCWLIGNMLALH